MSEDHPPYRLGDAIICPNCGRHRVLWDGMCEKCRFNVDTKQYVPEFSAEQDEEYDRHWEGLGKKADSQ